MPEMQRQLWEERMRTRIHEWMLVNTKGQRMRFEVRYGVQVKDGRTWKHCHRDGKPLIFTTRARAEKERAKLREGVSR
jgi:hypothetical protein